MDDGVKSDDSDTFWKGFYDDFTSNANTYAKQTDSAVIPGKNELYNELVTYFVAVKLHNPSLFDDTADMFLAFADCPHMIQIMKRMFEDAQTEPAHKQVLRFLMNLLSDSETPSLLNYRQILTFTDVMLRFYEVDNGNIRPVTIFNVLQQAVKNWITFLEINLLIEISYKWKTWTNWKTKLPSLLLKQVYYQTLNSNAQTMLQQKPVWAFANYDIETIYSDPSNNERIYNEIMFKRWFSYQQLQENPETTADYVIKHAAVISKDGITSLRQQINQSRFKDKRLEECLNVLTTKMGQNHSNEQRLVEFFIDICLLTCLPLTSDKKEMFVMRRMVEIMHNNRQIEMEKFLRLLLQDMLLHADGPISAYDKDTIKRFAHSLIRAFRSLHYQLSSRGADGQRPTHWPGQLPDDRLSPVPPTVVYTPPSPVQPQGDGAGGAPPPTPTVVYTPPNPAQPQGDGAGGAPPPNDTQDFTDHAVNKNKDPSQNQMDWVKGLHRDIYSKGRMTANKIAPYMSPHFLRQHHTRLNILNAVKHVAYNEYNKMLALNSFQNHLGTPDFVFTREFLEAEYQVAATRGEIMAHSYYDNERYSPQSLNTADPSSKESYPKMVAELQIFDGNQNQLNHMPVRVVMEAARNDLFTLRNKQNLMDVVNFLLACDWPDKTKNTPNLPDIDYSRVLASINEMLIHHDKDRLTHDASSHQLTLGSNFQDQDDIARTELSELKKTKFSCAPYSEATFQVATNAPFFTQQEVWQNWIVLNKINIDMEHCMKSKFAHSVDVKVKLKARGRPYELTWTIYRYKPDKFDVTHITYTSRNPTTSLLKTPATTQSIQQGVSHGDIDMNTLDIKHSQIDVAVAARMDELNLIQIHSEGANLCQGTHFDVSPKPITITASLGWVFYYNFWTVVASCYEATNNLTTEGFHMTAYTVIHRTSEYATDKGQRRQRTEQPALEPPNAGRGGRPPPRAAPPNRYEVNPRSGSASPQHFINPNIEKRVGYLKKAAKKSYPFLIFGLDSDRHERVYYYFPNNKLTDDLREVLLIKMFHFQKLVYEAYFPRLIEQLDREYISRQSPHKNIAMHIEHYYRGQDIPSYPGLFFKWIYEHPNGLAGQPANQRETAQKRWSRLWHTFFNEPEGYSLRDKYEVRPETQESVNTDVVIQEFIHNHRKKMEDQPHPPEDPRGSGPYQGQAAGRGQGAGRGHWGGRGGGRNQPHRPHPQGPEVVYHPQGGGRGGGRNQPHRPHPQEPEVVYPPPEEGPFESYGRSEWGDSDSEGRYNYGANSHMKLLPHMHTISETAATQISQMQHEIDTLRRSLNQLALLQG